NTDSEKKNELPKTGQGVFYGVIVAIAAAIIGSGIYLVTKKKK
ncbi:LPXTG cell wall anchor domain-containing protein, partial [Clostridium sp.]